MKAILALATLALVTLVLGEKGRQSLAKRRMPTAKQWSKDATRPSPCGKASGSNLLRPS